MIFVTHMEITPNPNALKYVLNEQILLNGICQIDKVEDSTDDLTIALFAINGVSSVFYRDNYVTVSKDADTDWIDVENVIKDEINNRIEVVEIKAQEAVKLDFGAKADIIEEIDQILDETIRPGLAMDGGGVDIVDLTDDMQLTVYYQGACGSCPSSTTGTLMAIQNILQDQFDPRILVKASNPQY
ncbi:MAG: NifU family protein [Lentisphaeraceae bacterium]|nr:NifU family protein [Lentisphaeraceae bacterium]